MDRSEMLGRAAARAEPFDIVVIGGGATGVGIAVDAASRGYATCLVEQSDLGKGTSSRSTKLVHGGVRYLQQGNVSLVMEALQERGLLRKNAPHLVSNLRFVVPSYDWWEGPFYGVGLKVYDLLAGRYGFGDSKILSREDTLREIPTLRTEGLRGGVLYHDGQFDDARLLVNLAQTAADQGALILNYAPAVSLRKGGDGLVKGVEVRDLESGDTFTLSARVVMCAAGAFTDAVLRMDDPAAAQMIQPSQGVHIVLDREFQPEDTAIMVPHTRDGRVMFAIPWHNKVVVGTTDTPIDEVSLEPRAQEEEIRFLLETAGQYLAHAPERSDVRSVFAGIRPLVRAGAGSDTAALSRDHTVHITGSGLVAVCGGKWTTYRNMAEDGVDQAAMIGDLEPRPCLTRDLPIHGHRAEVADLTDALAAYGSDAEAIAELGREEGLDESLHERLPYRAAAVVWAARHELARTVDDVLSRRTRALQLDADAAVEMAPRVAELLAAELGRDAGWQRQQIEEFRALAAGYQLTP